MTSEMTSALSLVRFDNMQSSGIHKKKYIYICIMCYTLNVFYLKSVTFSGAPALERVF
jgi:hypothetical protein